MPNKLTHKRTYAESHTLKEKIVSLRRDGKTMKDIAQELGITKQYVSLVLNKVGLGGDLMPAAKARAKSDNDELQGTIARLLRKGHYALADHLRLMIERRAANIESQQAKPQAK